MRDKFAHTLYQIAKQDPKTFIVCADISPAGSMEQFRKEFPDHFVNVGVAEQSMIGLCAGLALRGCTTFAYTIATFSIYRPFEQIRDDLCYQKLPVTVVGIGGGLSYSMLGGTHHAQEDVAIMAALPNMSVIAPCDPLETEAATWACAQQRGPVYLRLGKAGEPNLTECAAEPFEFGKIRKLKKGSGIAILSYGPITKMALDLANLIEVKKGGIVALFSVHTLKPLDFDGIANVLNEYDKVVVIEEHSPFNGLCAWIKQIAWDVAANCRLYTFSLKDEFIHVYGSQINLWDAHGINMDSIINKVCSE